MNISCLEAMAMKIIHNAVYFCGFKCKHRVPNKHARRKNQLFLKRITFGQLDNFKIPV